MSKESLGERGRALEGKFFHDREQDQIDRFRAAEARKAAVGELADITGFSDTSILEKVVALGVTPMTLAALSVVPMLHVAWADRVLDESERKSILLEATAMGLKSTSPAYSLLESWLTERPNHDLFSAWKAYHEALAEHLSADERARLRDQTLERADKVARASGGFLGFASVSGDEKRAIDELRAVFGD
jgi:hypothetical protein